MNDLPEKEGNKKLLNKIIDLENKLLQKDEEIKKLKNEINEIKIFNNNKFNELEKK